MNKQGKSETGKTIAVIVILLAVVLGAYLLISSSQSKTIQQHQKPADISSSQTGTGLNVVLKDAQGNPIAIPSWFSTSSIVAPGFAVVRHNIVGCSDRTACSGYATNPNIMCLSSQCVLGNVATIVIGINVTNPSTSQITFTNIAPGTLSPTVLDAAISKTPVASLAPGQSVGWVSSDMNIQSNGWIGTSQTFTVSATGTNSYTGQSSSVSDSVTLSFLADPSGALTVSIVSPI